MQVSGVGGDVSVCVVCVCVDSLSLSPSLRHATPPPVISSLITHHRPVLSNLSTLKSVTVGQTSAEALESFTV